MNMQTDNDMMPDLGEIDTAKRNELLDSEVLKDGWEVAGLHLRRISAGDMALLLDLGVHILIGRMESVFFDVGAVIFSQINPKEKVRRLAANPAKFRSAVYDLLDEYEPSFFVEAQPIVLDAINKMNTARTSIKGEASQGETTDPKAGGQAG